VRAILARVSTPWVVRGLIAAASGRPLSWCVASSRAAAWQQCENSMAATSDAESSGDEWGEKAGSLLYSALATCQDDDDDRESAKDQVSGAVPILSLRQRVEARLDEMDAYTGANLLKLCHVFILRRPAELVLVELGTMSISDREKYIILDTQNSILFWQGSESHHLRKLNVRAHSPLSRTLTYGCPPRALPRAHINISGFVAVCNDNSSI